MLLTLVVVAQKHRRSRTSGGQALLVARARIDESRQVLLARFKRILTQRAAKQLVAQPHLVSADYVGLAVVGDLLDLALAEVALHLTTIEPLRLSRQAHDPADFVKRGLSLRTKPSQDVTQID